MLQIVHVGRFWFALIGLLVMVGAVWQASQWGYQTRLMPIVVGVTGILLFLAELVSTVQWRPSPRAPRAAGKTGVADGRDDRRTVIMAVALVLYVTAMYYVGFIPASLAFLAATLYALGTREMVKIIGISVGTVLVVYLSLSGLLGVPLP